MEEHDYLESAYQVRKPKRRLWAPEEQESPYAPPPPPPLTAVGDWLAPALQRIAKPLPGHDDCPACIDRTPPTQERLTELRTMRYRDYLDTREWKEARKGALHRAGYRCQACDSRQRVIHVHHRTYDRRGHEWPQDLLVLCERCHRLIHGR